MCIGTIVNGYYRSIRLSFTVLARAHLGSSTLIVYISVARVGAPTRRNLKTKEQYKQIFKNSDSRIL